MGMVKTYLCKNNKGMTLLELVVSISVTSVLIVIIVGFITNLASQYGKQKEASENTREMLYMTEAFNTVDQWPEVRVKADHTELKVNNDTVNPSKETVYYMQSGSIYKNEFQNGILKNTLLLAKKFSVNFSLESDVSYSKDMLKVEITDSYGQTYIRKISLRDCEVVETY